MRNPETPILVLLLARLLQQLPQPFHLRKYESRIQEGLLQDSVRAPGADANDGRLGKQSTRFGRWTQLCERQSVSRARTASQYRAVRHLTVAVRSIPELSIVT